MKIDKKFLRSVAEIATEYDLAEISVKEEGQYEVTIKRGGAQVQTVVSGVAPISPAVVAPPVADIPHESVGDSRFDHIGCHEVKSPMVGVFYCAPGPGEAPFVSEGETVSAGDVLCIIEAMKIMNEIKADVSGKIVEVCCSDGDLVEFGQTIFKIK